MAWFHFCTSNHTPIGKSSLSDMSNWFEAGLLDLGHRVTSSHETVERQAINLFWECFPAGYDEVIKRTGVCYGIVATEIPTEGTFNWLDDEEWRERFRNFETVAKNASFIWSMVESAVPFYERYAPTAFMELGFSERLIPPYLNEAPTSDFCFFGLRTPYREKAIAEISRFAVVDWPETFLSAEEVGRLISRNKIGISFKQSERWPIPSPTRLGRFIMAQRGIAAENVPIPTRQGLLVGLCPRDQSFSDFALDILSSNWRLRAETVFDEYREKMAMSEIMERIIEETVPRNALKGSSQTILTWDNLKAARLAKKDDILPSRWHDLRRWWRA